MNLLSRNVNDALGNCLTHLPALGVRQESRNGPVLMFPGPVTTTYLQPTERVLFSTKRNANPVFHLMESLWMLEGRDDVQFPATFVKNMKNFSDDGHVFWGAYGHRWRRMFGYDQIAMIIRELTRNPLSRRCVLQMWNPKFGGLGQIPDLHQAMSGGKDVPCNTAIYFDTQDGKLNMTVTCRSNDILWGCYGANAVHMSMLQEYVALSVGVPVGKYHQFSNNLHLYVDNVKVPIDELRRDVFASNYYVNDMAGPISPLPLIRTGETMEEWDADLSYSFSAFDSRGVEDMVCQQYTTDFFNFTMVPMLSAWLDRKNPIAADRHAELIAAPDWRLAMRNWLQINYREGRA